MSVASGAGVGAGRVGVEPRLTGSPVGAPSSLTSPGDSAELFAATSASVGGWKLAVGMATVGSGVLLLPKPWRRMSCQALPSAVGSASVGTITITGGDGREFAHTRPMNTTSTTAAIRTAGSLERSRFIRSRR